MAEIMFAILIFSFFWGITSWCFQIAIETKVQQKLYSARDCVYEMVLSGKASMDDESVRELVLFIHRLIDESRISFLDLVISVVKNKKDSTQPSFLKDENLRPIAQTAVAAFWEGILWSSCLLLLAYCLIKVFEFIYKPFDGLLSKQIQSQQDRFFTLCKSNNLK